LSNLNDTINTMMGNRSYTFNIKEWQVFGPNETIIACSKARTEECNNKCKDYDKCAMDKKEKVMLN